MQNHLNNNFRNPRPTPGHENNARQTKTHKRYTSPESPNKDAQQIKHTGKHTKYIVKCKKNIIAGKEFIKSNNVIKIRRYKESAGVRYVLLESGRHE